MEIPKISVIVPIYNVERYVARCAESLFNQTLDNIEFIFIDDCSPDHSIEILQRIIDAYRLPCSEKNYTIRIERMPTNSGQAAVRRHGIQLARGKYIIHCDSDDWLNKYAYEECYTAAEKEYADIVFFDLYRTDGQKHLHIHREVPSERRKILSGLISGIIMGSLCCMMVHNSLYQNICYFPQNNMCEDLTISTQLVFFSKKCIYINRPFYFYFMNSESITAHTNKDKSISNFTGAYLNTKLILTFLNNNHLLHFYAREIEAMKISRLNILAPYVNDYEVNKIWKTSYPEISIRCILNPFIRNGNKFVYILSLFRIYPFIYKLRHRA